MADDAVAVARAAIDAVNRGDVRSFLAVVAEDAVLDLSRRSLNPVTYRGHDGVRAWLRDMGEAWTSFRWRITEVLVPATPRPTRST